MRADPEILIGIRLSAAEEPSTPPCGLVVWDIDTSEGLTPDAAVKAAYGMAVAARRYPGALLSVSLAGFDDDPRELVDIPEARDLLHWLGRGLEFFSEQPGELHGRLLEDHAALLAVCMGRLLRQALIFEPRSSVALEARL